MSKLGFQKRIGKRRTQRYGENHERRFIEGKAPNPEFHLSAASIGIEKFVQTDSRFFKCCPISHVSTSVTDDCRPAEFVHMCVH